MCLLSVCAWMFWNPHLYISMSWYFFTLKIIWEIGPTEALVTQIENTPAWFLVTFGERPSWNFVVPRGEVKLSSPTTLPFLVTQGFHLAGVIFGNLDGWLVLTSKEMCCAKSSRISCPWRRECPAAKVQIPAVVSLGIPGARLPSAVQRREHWSPTL